MQLKLEQKVKGTRIIYGNEAIQRKELLDNLYEISFNNGFSLIELPSLEKLEIYTDKAGDEVLSQTYNFFDKSDRHLCLRPEGTATIQLLANTVWKQDKDLKLCYFTRCWRYEKPQKGRYREFYQFGLEWLHPTNVVEARETLINIADQIMKLQPYNYVINSSVKRGLNYYTADGFEIECDELGSQKQVIGGGQYAEGIGFGVGFDRLALLIDSNNQQLKNESNDQTN